MTTAKITSRVVASSPSVVPSNIVANPDEDNDREQLEHQASQHEWHLTSDCQIRERLRRR